jgi:hypothetical protein
MTTIRMLKHYVTDGTLKARVWYSHGTLVDGRECVTLYAKDYTGELARIFKGHTDMMTDYFETGRVNIFPADPLYPAALARAAR